MLNLRVPLGETETAISFCSRLALRNAFPGAREFCLDLGLQFQGIVDGSLSALEALAKLGGADPERLAQWSLRNTANERIFQLRGQLLPRSSLRRAQVRVCPACLASDMARWPLLAMAAPYCRAEWQISSIRTCPIHGLSLVEVAHEHYSSLIHDFCLLTKDSFRDTTSLTASATERPPSYLENYLLKRLAGDAYPDTPWLNSLPFYTAARLCEIVGAVDLHGPQVRINSLTEDQWWAAGDTGFDTLASGPDGLRRLLEHLASSYWHRLGGTGPKALFGRLYEWLAHENEDRAYDPVRDVIRQHVLDTLPVGPGDDIFSQPVVKRRLHSIRSASIETGAHPKRLRKLLVAGGFISVDDLDLTDDRLLFTAEEAACQFLAKVSSAISLREAGLYINAPRVQLRLLVDNGFIIPFIRGGTEVLKDHAFAKHDLDEFLAGLIVDAQLTTDDDVLADIPTAARQARCSATAIVRLLQERKLTLVRRRQHVHGYMSVLVDPDEVRRNLNRPSIPGLSLSEVERHTGWSQDVVKALTVHGHLPSLMVQNPINHLRQTVVAQADLEAFATRYVSLHGLAKERGIHFNRIKAALEAAGVHPVFDTSAVPATFYLRAQLPPG